MAIVAGIVKLATLSSRRLTKLREAEDIVGQQTEYMH